MKTLILSKSQVYLLIIILVLTAFLIANSGFLFFTTPSELNRDITEGFYETSAYGKIGTQSIGESNDALPARNLPPFYQIMLLTHIIGGITLLVLFIGFVLWHVKDAWLMNNKKAIRFGIILAVSAFFLGFSGFFIMSEANSTQNRWIFYSHRALAIGVPLLYIGHRLMSTYKPSPKRITYAFSTIAGLWIILLGIHAINQAQYPKTIKGKDYSAQPITASSQNNGKIVDPFIPFNPTNLGEENSPFFPSPTTTSTGQRILREVLTMGDKISDEQIEKDMDKYGFVINDSMGSDTCARCHAAIVDQWSKSAHRFSSFNNLFYKASVDNLRDEENGFQRSQWCGACHDPVLMFQGKMLEKVDTHWPESQAGLTCLSCHLIDEIHGKEANGNYNLSAGAPSPYLFAMSKSGPGKLFHDMLVKSKPNVHKQQMLKSFFRSPEYCMSCHKVSLDTPINHYRWLRGQDDYDAWHDSGVARNASRTFYLPPTKRVCQDCHMPLERVELPDVSAKNGMVKSHRFLAVNTALPYMRGDDKTVQLTEKFLQDDKMRVDIFALRRENEQIPFPAIKTNPPTIQYGETIQVDVIVRNKGVGHTYPGGTNDSNESWIHFKVKDDKGRLIYESGRLGENGRVDPKAHFYKVLFVDKNSQPALHRDPQNFHAVVYARVIPPGSSDVVRYRFTVPKGTNIENLDISAQLKWRKFNRDFTEFVFNREPLPNLPRFEGKTIPDLPVTVVASDSVQLPLSETLPEKSATGLLMVENNDWIRFNDYGNAHFRHQDFRTADWAFTQVAKLQPEKVDGPRNRARVAIMEGNIEKAYDYLEQCEALAPGDPQTAWFWGLAKKEEGLYEEAANAFQRVLAYFPEDRASWRELGRTYYLDGKYEDSLKAFLELLKIDPENRIAHYHRTLCYRALGEQEKAAEAEKAYLKYQIDESAAQATQKYRLENPTDNYASQKIIIYELDPNPQISIK